MRKAEVAVHGVLAGLLTENNGAYQFCYLSDYLGPPVSLTMPVRETSFEFAQFPPFFDGLLPEGDQLEGLLRSAKIDRGDFFSQLMCVGADLVGAVTVREVIS